MSSEIVDLIVNMSSRLWFVIYFVWFLSIIIPSSYNWRRRKEKKYTQKKPLKQKIHIDWNWPNEDEQWASSSDSDSESAMWQSIQKTTTNKTNKMQQHQLSENTNESSRLFSECRKSHQSKWLEKSYIILFSSVTIAQIVFNVLFSHV